MQKDHTKIAFVAAALFVACASSKPPEANSAPMPAPSGQAPPTTKESPAQAAQSGNVQISPDILKACGIPDADAFFPFDSASLEKKDIAPLNAVATCFSTGPMKGHVMKLIGRADPRGAPEYNMTLGQARADSVEKYVVNKGVNQNMVQSTSRGAMDATGTDEAGWARDRRVDIVLGS